MRNRMEIAISIAIRNTQIALFVAPLLVLLSLARQRPSASLSLASKCSWF